MIYIHWYTLFYVIQTLPHQFGEKLNCSQTKWPTFRVIGRLHLATLCPQTAAVKRYSSTLTQPADMLSGSDTNPRERPLVMSLCIHLLHHCEHSDADPVSDLVWSVEVQSSGWRGLIRILKSWFYVEYIKIWLCVYVTNIGILILQIFFFFLNTNLFFMMRLKHLNIIRQLKVKKAVCFFVCMFIKGWLLCGCAMADRQRPIRVR